MMASCMPAELVVQLSGHDFKKVCALWDYLDVNLALTMPGSICLTKWPPLAWGQNGQGPKPPSLEAVMTVGCVSLEAIDFFADVLFRFTSASPKQLLVGAWGVTPSNGPCILGCTDHVVPGPQLRK